ncbi:MAG TPA: ABC transporter permease subunit [Polyangiaceae bacterium]|nr:ABC transporter permease subunit [Polyangiaceae bacterium]
MNARVERVFRGASLAVLLGVAVAAAGGRALAPHVPGVVGALVLGARETAATAVVAFVTTLGLGVLLGGLAAFGPRLLDSALSRSVETAASLPSVVTALAVVRAASAPPAVAFGVVIGVLRGLALAKAMRAELRALSVAEFSLAARALGSGEPRLYFTHLLPHVMPSALGVALQSSSAAVSLESALAFLGLGGGGASWGQLLADGIGRGTTTLVAAAVAATLATVLALLHVARTAAARFGVRRDFV